MTQKFARERSANLGSIDSSWIIGVIVITLLSIPLFFSPAPMSVDLNNHLVRFVAIADHFDSATLAPYYIFIPEIFPNLGMDVLGSAIIYLLGPIIGSQVASSIVLVSIPIGFLFLCKCIHGHVKLIHFAFCSLLAYSHIFVWGFANFLLGSGVAIALLGLWIKTSDSDRRQLLAGIIGGMVLIFVHALSFAIFGILLFAYEFGQWLFCRSSSFRDLIWRTARLLVIALAPTLYFLLSRTAESSQGALFFVDNVKKYSNSIAMLSRIVDEIISRFELLLTVPDSGFWLLNVLIGALVVLIVIYAIVKRVVEVDTRLLVPVIALVFLWGFLPPNIYGSGYANDRIPLLLWSVGFASLRWKDAEPGVRTIGALSISALAFTNLVVIYLTYSLAASSYRLYVNEMDRGKGSNVAVTLLYGGADRTALQPYCSAFEFLSFSRRGYAVQTFEYVSQQPIKTGGTLNELVRRRLKDYPNEMRHSNAAAGRSSLLQGFIQDHIDMGFEIVTVCGMSHQTFGPGEFRPISTGPFWSVYSR